MKHTTGWDDLNLPVPQSIVVAGIAISPGQRVRLRPRAGGDVMDLTLNGHTAVVEAIEVTTDGEPHFIVTVEDDPGRDLSSRRYPGHRFFFRTDEIEPLEDDDATTEASRPRILVAGIGNIFFGDDGFGVEVARRLSGENLPDGVVVRDYGIRGLDLAYALQEELDAAILVDAMPHGGEPGSLHVLEPNLEAGSTGGTLDAHVMDPVRVLRLAQTLGEGRLPERLVVVGCQPATLEGGEALGDDLVALSPAVRAAAGRAVGVIMAVIHDLTSTAHSRSKETNYVDSGVGLGHRRDSRGSVHRDHDSQANPADAPVFPHQGDVANP